MRETTQTVVLKNLQGKPWVAHKSCPWLFYGGRVISGVRPVGIYEMKPTLTDVEYRLISIRKISFAVTVTAKWDTLNISVR
jgi:hypothetical protein